ncbi:30S ribosomal protein S19 [Candidatus Marsarchaeota G2 archaeon OSP_D]|jgi:ribosomal protein S19(archaeal)/S15(eukaryotic)|uniref:Small ribosomal subunit protein uS19 n=7 Tax=Candidatus Marsarchaeota group 2 TaxID=2203771 RepID=A0A2R6CB18_9ARCH|nr:MAG: 30S ribosomal protein S19 [Candidatus Marsarchaeota G2 archaeon OSP_D]PSN96050.1 MAG: 30S ribosomal protein S19 [Candidatus Marsarchaeota G2 archaeon ECH_B_SAG-C16]PSN96820.1 MAG: 30S ribosomal protein S19 [Candidatus Marsarchaeota G2 archaeon ECH_B_2]PSO01389.1 MAG: 30S ribosomal protein S19 [Candidatus Marsarchaeota G2 archaeon ECH_B_3]PSO03521.1 MAG: 30S ribosomal protein S19 [Candidatus Marsarchaeota G2 archaeon ECH_B_1]PSO08094.1 MAG: 30S ribosomal protein S19 [Candidatus Marsarch
MSEAESLRLQYKGYDINALAEMNMEDLIKLFPARVRRSLKRGIKPEQAPLIEKIRKIKRDGRGPQTLKLRTHCRDLIVLPEMVGLTIHVHNGKEFVPIEIKPEMLGHYLGEYAITTKRVVHGEPGIRATRSSMYVPLK